MKNSNELRTLGPVFRNHPNTPNTLKSTTDPYHDLYNWVKPSLMWNVEFKTFNYFSYFHAYYLGFFAQFPQIDPVHNDTAAFNHHCTINRVILQSPFKKLRRNLKTVFHFFRIALPNTYMKKSPWQICPTISNKILSCIYNT